MDPMIKTLRAAACLLAAALAVTAATTGTSSAAVADDHAEVQRVLDEAVTDGGMPGVITEIREGRESWFGRAGVADTETGRERRRQEHFRAASVTKSFTATVVLKLAAEGRLSLDDTVDTWLPGVVRGNGHDGTKVTIRQLLNNTSGIFPYISDTELATKQWTPAFLEGRFDSYRPEDLLKYALRNPAQFEPGKSWSYSNSNYILAA
jgi:D-alanyl-D-alanine carboxypeptidase